MAVAANTNLKIVGAERFSASELAAHERRLRASRRRVAPYDPRALTAGDLGTEATLRSLFSRATPTERELALLQGVLTALLRRES